MGLYDSEQTAKSVHRFAEQCEGGKVHMRGKNFALVVTLLAAILLFAACGGDETTPRSFGDDEPSKAQVQPPAQVKSEVSLSYKKGKFHVDVSADRDYCVEERKVAILEEGRRKDVRIGRVTTDADGLAALADKRAAGRFVAVLAKQPSAKYGDVSICLGDRSKTVKV